MVQVMFRSIAIACVFALSLWGNGLACDQAQSGNTIFEDDFSDDSGGWQTSENARIQSGALAIVLEPDKVSWGVNNFTFDIENGDFCVDVLLPFSLTNNRVRGGLSFWGIDYANHYLFQIGNDSTASLYRRINGAWHQIYSTGGLSLKKTEPNNIRVVTKSGSMTLFVNGQEIKRLRAQRPAAAIRFGLYAEIELPPKEAVAVTFEGFKITTGG